MLALWTLAITVLLARYGVDNHYVFDDEADAILLGRAIVDDPSLILTGTVARGPERMTSLFAAVATSVTDGPTRQVELLHLASAICQGLVTAPVWLAARELGLGRWAALVPAAIASAGSVAFYGVFTLNAAPGLLAATLLLWAMVRALGRPGLGSDLLVAGTLALTILSRIGWAPLVAALVPAVLAAVWRSRPPDEGLRTWLRRLPRRLLQRHPLLTPLASLLAVVALAAGPSALLGHYGSVRLQPDFDPSLLWTNTRTLAAHLAIAVAVVPLVLALPMIARGLVRPADAVEGGFAWLVLALVVVFSYAYYASMNEDRYFAVLCPPVVLAGAFAVFRRPPPPWSVLASGALVTALAATSYQWSPDGVIGYFVAPTSRFFDDVVVGKLTQRLPGSASLLAAAVVLVAVLAAFAVVALARRPRALGRTGIAAAGLLLAGILAFQLAAMDHPARKFTQRAGMGTFTPAMLELVDRGGGGKPVRALAVDGVVDPDLEAQQRLLQTYNVSLDSAAYTVWTGPSTPRTMGAAAIDWRTGRVTVADPPPALLLQLAGGAHVGFAGTTLPSREPFPWAQLVRLRLPLRASWVLRGTQVDRYPKGGTAVRVRVFPDGGSRRCLTALVLAHPYADGRVRYLLAGGERRVRGTVAPGLPREIAVRVSGGRPTTVTLAGRSRRLPDGTSRGPTLANVSVGRCARR